MRFQSEVEFPLLFNGLALNFHIFTTDWNTRALVLYVTLIFFPLNKVLLEEKGIFVWRLQLLFSTVPLKKNCQQEAAPGVF